MIKIIAAVSLLSLALAGDTGPSKPLEPYTAADCTPGLRIVDQDNMCWYHLCLMKSATEYYTLPLRCPTGTKVPYDFTASVFSACTFRFPGDSDFDCERKQETAEAVPECASTLVCENGGNVTYQGSSCWCECPEEWKGDWQCGRPTGAYIGAPEGSDVCVGGEPGRDWCNDVGGCLHGGTCFNQCDSYWCDCTYPFNWSKRCHAEGEEDQSYATTEYATAPDGAFVEFMETTTGML